jgi:predicted ATPase
MSQSSDTMMTGTPEPMNMVILEGLSGTGKSAIVREFKQQIVKSPATSPVLFSSGKFDQLHHPRVAVPYSAFTMALEELCAQYSIRYASPEENPLRDALGDDYRHLVDLVPNLVSWLNLEVSKLYDSTSKDIIATEVLDNQEFDIVKSQRRFQYAVKSFLFTICKPEQPTIMFLDDLQWSDQPSLDLLELILKEPKLEETLLIVGSYRSNEVDQDHPLCRRLKIIERDRKQIVERIQVSNLAIEDVNQLIADLLNSTLEEAKPLAETAQKKVQGNVFFLIQFLTALRDGGYLEFNIGTAKWTWELNSIRKSVVISHNVLAYLLQRISSLPDSLRNVLVILSCLGSCFEEEVVDILVSGLDESGLLPFGSGVSAQDLLLQLQDEGLVESFKGKDGRNAFCFAHDQIELAAKSLQDDDFIHVLKLQMAQILYKGREFIDFSANLFLIVDV